jgi:hypothetical protein
MKKIAYMNYLLNLIKSHAPATHATFALFGCVRNYYLVLFIIGVVVL